MTLSDYVAALKRGWLIILSAFLLAMACAAVVVVLRPDVYTATTQLYVASVEDENESSSTDNQDFAGSRVVSYATVLGGNVMADRVDEEVGGSGSESVTVAALADSVILQVSVSGDDAQRVTDVAQAYARTAPSVIEGLEQDSAGRSRVKVTVFDEADVPSAPDAVARVPLIAGAGILGLGLGVSIVLIRETLRRERSAASRQAEQPPVSRPAD